MSIKAHDLSSVGVQLFQSVPNVQGAQWTNRLYNLPRITFSTIYDYLVNQKIVLKKLSYLENMADKRAEAVQNHAGIDVVVESSGNGVPIEYTRTLDKAYRFSRWTCGKHKISSLSVPNDPEHICVSAVILPSMRKDSVYNVPIFIHESAGVAQACCSCPAELSGCCKHVIGTLYCLEESYIHSGLQAG